MTHAATPPPPSPQPAPMPPHRRPLLEQVAAVYAANEPQAVERTCFVFPNKRSATFFRHYMSRKLPGVTPVTSTITAFVAEFSAHAEASRYDQLFVLYNEYRRLAAEHAQPDDKVLEFDTFIFWGEMLLGDFDDVDRYLADPDALFVNVERFKEISSSYLSGEQLAAIRRFWGDEVPEHTPEQFWNHMARRGANGPHIKFMRLWEIMAPLYHAFHAALEKQRLTTSGMMHRRALRAISSGGRADLHYDRYVFVGFNVLSTSEIRMFEKLQAMDAADFYWDFNSPALADPANTARRFVELNARQFASRYELPEGVIDEMPRIEVIGAPGHVAQVKVAGTELQAMVADGRIDNPDDAINTAVVLPDQSLFLQLAHSIPPEISQVNLTMGLPVRHSPLATVMHHVAVMQRRARRGAEGFTFFHEDVMALVKSGAVQAINPEQCAALADEITTRRRFRITAADIAALAPDLAPIFSPVKEADTVGGVCDYLVRITDMIAGAGALDHLERMFVADYREKIMQLRDATERHSISMRSDTLLGMIERAVRSDKIHFAGEPLSGLQVMGVLETRGLDFDNVIILSMNERVFPARHFRGSFIPDTLRRGYGLPTAEFQESLYAYHFYRLISRARSVTLIYDARTIGTSTGEVSRYISQLLYLEGGQRITHRTLRFDIDPHRTRPLEMPKTPAVMRALSAFTRAGGRNLSASSLNEYIRCPLAFYLRFAEQFDPNDEIKGYIDDSTYGTIAHDVMQAIYEEMRGPRPEVTVTAEMLQAYIDAPQVKVQPKVTAMIRRHYLNRPDSTAPLTGETLVMSRVITSLVVMTLEQERTLTPLVFVAAEEKMSVPYEVRPGLTVNFTQKIDRIDRVGDTVRIVDYKSGSDELKIDSLASAFVHTPGRNVKAFFQLMLYCLIFKRASGYEGPLQPLIYKLSAIPSEGIVPLKIKINPDAPFGRGNEKEITDFAEYAAEFEERLRGLLEEIFNPEVPLRQTDDPNGCGFCKFTRICGRS